MAVKSITLAARPSINRNKIRRRVAIQVNGNYAQGGISPAAPGETIDLTTMLNPSKVESGKFAGVGTSANSIPSNAEIAPVLIPWGYDAQLVRNPNSPTLKNYILQFFTSGGTELGAGAYPAALANTDIVFEIEQGLKRC